MSSEALRPASGPSRRTVVTAVGVAGIALTAGACGTEKEATPSAASGTALGRTSEIPEGGGKIFGEAGIVVTQPKAGEFKAFSAKCTHQGCAVSEIKDGVIVCPCHRSEFSVVDGSAQKGPAVAGLPEQAITVKADTITVA
jgi:Rieske Fe-S protein